MPNSLQSSAGGHSTVKNALACHCPACGKGYIFKPGFLNMAIREHCESCGFPLGQHDSADGPAVFLIFILGFLLVPLALLVEFTFSPPLWFHAVFWGMIALGMTLGMLRPVKAYIIGLQFKHRPDDWKEENHGTEKEPTEKS